jgi:iron(III) transport system ATP-binding protein
MVFQDFALFPHLDVEQNLAFGLTHLQPEARAGRVRSVLSLCGLTGLEQRRPSQLSGGQQQRVALARALAPHPRLLLLDEPFASLDANLRVTTREQTAAVLRKVGATALLVTHDQEEAMCFAERLVVLRDGRIEQQGTPEQVYRSPKNAFVATFLGEANVLRAEAQGRRAQSAFGSVELQTEARGSVQICIRPEAIELQPPVGQALTARITSREYLGSRFVYRVRQNEREWLVASGADRPWSVGEAVALVVRSPAAVLDGE